MVFEAHEEVKQKQADIRDTSHASIDEVANRALQRRDGQRFENDDQLVSPRDIAEELGIDHKVIRNRLERDPSIAHISEEMVRNGKGTRRERYYPRHLVEGLFEDEQWVRQIKAVTGRRIHRNPRLGR